MFISIIRIWMFRSRGKLNSLPGTPRFSIRIRRKWHLRQQFRPERISSGRGQLRLSSY
jgi:hypothetical protein